eukprot:gnl/TRDRNA2_/TRDRNA2_162946_c1_seq5.p1 gnl/TRDRNA2_/TRDRNA2_162946_c1~~gnl/TRDRNA2_/TRDRNA2_162946_c1_seq5.p1  ORF type:complete len:276 (+),score=39.94 gnl/TRDRNA2_/TRDRNA2_162946_c1_seq5:47-829(+)
MAGEPAEPPRMVHTILGSAMSGLLSRVPCHPLDTVKARLQSAGGSRYRGIVDCLRLTWAGEGLAGLYRGFGAVAVAGTPATVMYMTSYEAAKRVLSAEDSELAFAGHLSAGLVAEAVACIIFVPVDVIKERLQVQRAVTAEASASAPPAYKGSLDAVRVIGRTEGLRGLYKGYMVTLGSFGPFSALYFAFYEEAKATVAKVEGAAGVAALSTTGAPWPLGGATGQYLGCLRLSRRCCLGAYKPLRLGEASAADTAKTSSR